MRDRDFYRKLFVDTEHDPIDEADLDKLIKFIAMLGDRTEEDGELEDDYDTMDPEDFLRKALGEDGDGDDDDEEEDGSPWRHNVDEEYNDAGGEGIDSVGDDDDESEDKKKPDLITVSDEGEKKKKGGGCVSDKGMKKVRRRRGPSEEDLTRSNIAATLRDLRF